MSCYNITLRYNQINNFVFGLKVVWERMPLGIKSAFSYNFFFVNFWPLKMVKCKKYESDLLTNWKQVELLFRKLSIVKYCSIILNLIFTSNTKRRLTFTKLYFYESFSSGPMKKLAGEIFSERAILYI